MAGRFADLYLDFDELSTKEQARLILKEARAAVDQGAKGAAITYSANHDQTLRIREAYAQGAWRTGIAGANQAAVMTALEEELAAEANADLRRRMRIAPITTMGYPTDSDADHLRVVQDDLAKIAEMLGDGWTVFGWTNQKTAGTEAPYAVGGGVAGRLPEPIGDAIQATLKGFAQTFTR